MELMPEILRGARGGEGAPAGAIPDGATVVVDGMDGTVLVEVGLSG
jgi:hypothetical protein